MAMTQQLWSINALATELCIDRRTLAKRLADLPPAEDKKIGARIEKRWHLADAVGHLGVKVLSSARQEDDEAMDGFKKIIGEALFPAIITSGYFANFTTGYMEQELALSETDARRVFLVFVVGLAYAFADVTEDPDLTVTLPPDIEALFQSEAPSFPAARPTRR